MDRIRLAAAVVVWAAVGSSGCGGAAAAREDSPAPPQAEPGAVAATIGGEPISLADVDDRVRGQISSLEQQIYELRRQTLQQVLTERLLQREAERRGVSVEELRTTEIARKAEDVTEAGIDELYERVRSRARGRTKEQLRPELELEVRRQNLASREREYREELARAAGVRMVLAPPRSEVPIPPDAPSLGSADTPVTIVAFSDYQCPYCHRAQETVEDVLELYGGKVRLVHRDFPLDFHAGAVPAARAARCAGEQDRFWDYHRGLLSRMTDYSESDLKRRADELELDPEAFAECLASGRHDDAIQASFQQARELGVSATPTFFINGRRLEGARSIEHFVEVIDEELVRAEG
jgi:protein-disulfide isomerase